MYLKSFKIFNFRKFGIENNAISFVDANYNQREEGGNINVAPTTTLIVGKNNSGKTTITNALDILINKDGAFRASDFNFSYLKNLLMQYKVNSEIIETPYLQFELIIGIENDSNDLITNLVPFMVLKDVNKSQLEILAKYELQEKETFSRDVENLLKSSEDEDKQFKLFLELIDKPQQFQTNYYNASGEKINFNLKNLIGLKPIKANNIQNENSLSKAFSTIIKYRFKTLIEEGEQDLNQNIDEINKLLTGLIEKKHTKDINNSIEKIEAVDRLKVSLTSDLTYQRFVNDLIKYEYIEKGNNIPENQFGLGYTNLMMIIAELIDYMERYPTTSFNSRVNLISIEEPETYMHPQMQELFIKNINDAIGTLLQSKNKNVNSQLIVTTHSSHILNSKVHTGNTFNNINYVTIKNYKTHVVNLNDGIIMPKSPLVVKGKKEEELIQERKDNLNFLKKHIKYKVSELFFSDALIFVEGVTEETLLNYYIDQIVGLNKYYISIFNIDGAHGLVYHELIKQLDIPALIITDLDICRSEEEKEKTFSQISDLTGRTTTNKTIIKFNRDLDKIDDLPDFIEDENIYLAYQRKIEGYFPTSFEEAFILTNYNNSIVNDVLASVKPNIYKEIVGPDQCIENIMQNSYKLQRKLSKSKSDFANQLLFKYLTASEKDTIPTLPVYINDGLMWLEKKLAGSEIDA